MKKNIRKKTVKYFYLGFFLPLVLGFYFSLLGINNVLEKENLAKKEKPQPKSNDRFAEGVECLDLSEEQKYMFVGCNGFY